MAKTFGKPDIKSSPEKIGKGARVLFWTSAKFPGRALEKRLAAKAQSLTAWNSDVEAIATLENEPLP